MPPQLIPRRRIVRGSLDERHYHKFMEPPHEPPVTLDRRTPDVRLKRELVREVEIPLPFTSAAGRRSIDMWVIADPARNPTFPGHPVRVRQGQVVHVEVKTHKGVHNIHWHGIEPTPMNDGVGKHSFEIEDSYTYQWSPTEAGSYFYHCHKNTTLHFEMGLFGGLIVDPPQGPGYVRRYDPANGHVARYDRELIWAVSAHDSRWHELSHDAYMVHSVDANDPGSFTRNGILHNWRPDVFMISGAVVRNASTVVTDSRAAGLMTLGETMLIRLLDAAYAELRVRIAAPVEVIAQDGRALGVPPFNQYSRPYTLAANTPIVLTTAMRHDLLLRPTSRGVIPVSIEYRDWRGQKSFITAKTQITVM